MLRRQLFINTCTFLMMVLVVLQVLTAYNRTKLTFALKIVTLTLVDSCFESRIFFNCRNAALAIRLYPILLVHTLCFSGT
uniref:Secreted protein n=1 Tax=Schistosoma curassoni TaxID=6186 RepID=A0A183KGD4_9TREM